MTVGTYWACSTLPSAGAAVGSAARAASVATEGGEGRGHIVAAAAYSLFYVQIIHILAHKLFPCFPGPTSLSGSLNSKSNTFFTQSSSSFLKTCPYHRNLFLCNTFTMTSVPNRCLNSTQCSLCLNFAPHAHLPTAKPVHFSYICSADRIRYPVLTVTHQVKKKKQESK